MTALTLTPQPDTASVAVQITGAPAGAVAITRVDANGSRPVRLRSGQTPISGSLTVTDYEAALTGPIRYDVVDSASATTSAYASMLRTNLISNPSFEEQGTDGWGASNPANDPVLLTDNSGTSGTNYVSVTKTGTEAIYISTALEVPGPGVYTLSYDVKSSTATATDAVIDCYTGPDLATYVSSVSTASVTFPANSQWKRITHVVTIPAGTHHLELAIYATTGTVVGSVAYFDSVVLESGQSDGSYFSEAAGRSAIVRTPQVHVPVLPQYRAQVSSVTGYDAARDSSTTRHQVIGRPDPVTVLGVLRTREGRLRMWCKTYEDAKDLEAVAAVGEVLMLRQTDYPGMDMYFIADGSRITPDQSTINGQRWAVEWDYAEVAVPTADLLGAAGWSFNNVAALARFRDVKQTYKTFAALAVG